MDRASIIWGILSIVIFIPIVLYGIQAIKLKRNNGDPNIIILLTKFTIGGFLMLMSCLLYMSTISWLAPWRVIPFIYSALLTYSANVWIATNKHHILLKSNSFKIVNIISIIIIITGYTTVNNIEMIISKNNITPTLIYYIHYLFCYIPLMMLNTKARKLYKQSIKSSTDLTYRARRYIGLISLRMIFMVEFIFIANTILYLFFGNTYREMLNNIFYLLLPGIGLIPFTNTFPQALLKKIVHPFERLIEKKKRHEHELLTFLHQHITTLVPKVRLLNTRFNDLRVLIEIEDARDIVMSQEQHPSRMSPINEACHIQKLLAEGTILNDAGNFKPPVIRRNSRKYILNVAQHLQRLMVQNAVEMEGTHG